MAWYTDDAVVIPIGLPEIDHNSMIGFLNSDYKLRRVDNDDDIAYFYDEARGRIGGDSIGYAIFTRELSKLKERFHAYTSSRESAQVEKANTILTKNDLNHSVGMSNEAWIMLLFAADYDGTIEVSKTLSGSTYIVGGKYNMNESQQPREIAKWNAAIQALMTGGYINLENSSNTNTKYMVTDKGYKSSDGFKEIHGLNTSRTPKEALADLLAHYRQQNEEQEQYAQEIENYLSFDPYH